MAGGARRRLLTVSGVLLCSLMEMSAATKPETWDYIIVGSGPGGATMARLLTADPDISVLLLEAGEDRDEDSPIMSPEYVVSVADDYYAEYFWQAAELPNDVTAGDDQYTNGRLLGGGSSINGQQWVPPSLQWLEQLFLASGKDPDWKPSQVLSLLQKLEHFHGPKAVTFPGREGPVPVRYIQGEGFVSPSAKKFVKAVKRALGYDSILDYTDPKSPIGPFVHWQVSQYPNGQRGSASVAMLTKTVRERKNLTIKTRSYAMRVLFDDKKMATGLEYTEAGDGKVAYARKEVILAAGHHSSLILECSGVGNKEIIKSMLEDAGKPFIMDLPGVGENLGNDGVVTATFTRNDNDKVSMNMADLYVGGAFLPYPGADGPSGKSGTLRFSEWFCIDPMPAEYHASKESGLAPANSSFSIGAIMLNVSSRGFAHIQSADPLYQPLATTKAMDDPVDLERWVTLFEEQVKPIAAALQEIDPAYTLTSPDPALFDIISDERRRRKLHGMDMGGGGDAGSLGDFITGTYVHSHHWFGTCSMGDQDKGGVVDSSGRVHGVQNLRVADASIIPIKPDGNTQVPAYIMGSMIAHKILGELK